MRNGMKKHTEPSFNEIRIDLQNQTNRYFTDTEHRSYSTVPNRAPRYAQYRRVQLTNIHQPNVTTSTSKDRSSAISANHEQKFDPQPHGHLTNWLWLSIICAIFFFPVGIVAVIFSTKAQTKFRSGLIQSAYRYNRAAFILCVVSILSDLALIFILTVALDGGPRTNG